MTVSLLFAAFAISFVPAKFGSETVNGFIAVNMPMALHWYLYYLCDAVSNVLIGWFVVRAVRVKLKPFAVMYLVYCIYDLGLFLWCYNQKNYYYLPYAVMLLIAWRLTRFNNCKK